MIPSNYLAFSPLSFGAKLRELFQVLQLISKRIVRRQAATVYFYRILQVYHVRSSIHLEARVGGHCY